MTDQPKTKPRVSPAENAHKARIAEILVGLRTQAGVSQKSLAKRVGVTFQQIQKYEKGFSNLSVQRLKTILEVLESAYPETVCRAFDLGSATQSTEAVVRKRGTLEISKNFNRLSAAGQSDLLSVSTMLVTAEKRGSGTAPKKS